MTGVFALEELPEYHAGMSAEVDVAGAAGPTGLLKKLQDGRFVISVEVDPPRAFTAEKQIEGARHAKSVGADAVNVADSPMARVRMGALALCTQIQQQVDIETILHFTTRDRSLMGLQADLIGAHALGVRNILALTGDPPGLGDTQQSTPVYDVDSIGLVRIIDSYNEGYDLAGREMGRARRLHHCRGVRSHAARPAGRGGPLSPEGERRRALHDDAAHL